MTEATTTAPVETKNEAVPELMPDPITLPMLRWLR